jgi:hypothetical protein
MMKEVGQVGRCQWGGSSGSLTTVRAMWASQEMRKGLGIMSVILSTCVLPAHTEEFCVKEYFDIWHSKDHCLTHSLLNQLNKCADSFSLAFITWALGFAPWLWTCH